jgi:NitT/TauT family transport system permease protein
MKIFTSKDDRQTIDRKKNLYITISTIGLVLIWHLSALTLAKPYILPTPVESMEAFIHLVFSRSFHLALFYTLLRVLSVVAVSTFLGIVFGILSGRFTVLEHLLSPLVLLIKTVPTIVLIVYVVLWMSGYLAPIFVTILITFPVVYGNVLEGYKRIDEKLIELADVYKFNWIKKLRTVLFPSIKPYIQSSVLAIGGLGLKVVIASEVLSQTQNSLGRSFQIARMNIDTSEVLALAMVTIIISVVLDELSKHLLKKMN